MPAAIAPAFLPAVPVSSGRLRPHRHATAPRRAPRPHAPRATAAADPSAPAAVAPDAGLTGAAGATGTVCTNLFPLPVLGDYGWFLTVYRRDLSARTGPFRVRETPDALELSFAPTVAPVDDARQRSFTGLAAGNLNVRAAATALHAAAHDVLLYDATASEPFFRRRNELRAYEAPSADAGLGDVWRDPAPTYSVIRRAATHETRVLHGGGGLPARAASRFEWFATSLASLPVLGAYGCVVAVWRQERGCSPVCIDKIGGRLVLRFFDPLELVDGMAERPVALGTFAVKVFFGAVTDAVVAELHKALLKGVRDEGGTVLSESDFRLVVDNKPGVFTPNRRNEIWVQVK